MECFFFLLNNYCERQIFVEIFNYTIDNIIINLRVFMPHVVEENQYNGPLGKFP